MSVSQIPLTAEQAKQITNHINNYRSMHSSPNMTYNNSITDFSLNWSSYLLKNKLFEHSNNKSYGENLAYFKGYDESIVALVKRAIDMWYNEIFLYDYKNHGFSSATGHFTTLIWKASIEYGMGVAVNKDTNEVVITMNTSPPGNIIGQFQENVLPKTIEITPTPMPEPEPEQESDNGNIPETLMPTNGDEFDDDEQEEGEEELNPELVEKLSKIISGMYNVIQMIQTRKNAYTIRLFLLQIANVVREVKEDEFPEKMRILSSIYNLISVIRRRYSRYVAVRYIANMIYKLEQFLMASYTK